MHQPRRPCLLVVLLLPWPGLRRSVEFSATCSRLVLRSAFCNFCQALEQLGVSICSIGDAWSTSSNSSNSSNGGRWVRGVQGHEGV